MTLDAFEIRDGYRYQAFTTTNTARRQLAFLEAGSAPRERQARPMLSLDSGL